MHVAVSGDPDAGGGEGSLATESLLGTATERPSVLLSEWGSGRLSSNGPSTLGANSTVVSSVVGLRMDAYDPTADPDSSAYIVGPANPYTNSHCGSQCEWWPVGTVEYVADTLFPPTKRTLASHIPQSDFCPIPKPRPRCTRGTQSIRFVRSPPVLPILGIGAL